jgi:antagonist of KipI
MSIEILKPGLFSIVVDEGRPGFRSAGIGPCGAMDRFAHHVANYLVGNRGRAATIEIRFPAPEIRFHRAATICVGGSGVEPNVDGETIGCWNPTTAAKGSVLGFARARSGSTAYIAVAGGWQADSWLGSFTTQTDIAAGGHHGRPLGKKDILEFNAEAGRPVTVPDTAFLNAIRDNVYQPAHEIRCIATAETSRLSPDSLKKLTTTPFTISVQSNRMGFRLEGVPLELTGPLELVSSPVDFGTLQLLPTGQLIVLMADHQTTGGYPRIASVIEADLPKLSQHNPGDRINFRIISFSEAEAALLSRQQQLEEIRRRLYGAS